MAQHSIMVTIIYKPVLISYHLASVNSYEFFST